MLNLGPKQRDDQLKITEFLYLGTEIPKPFQNLDDTEIVGPKFWTAVLIRGSVCVRFRLCEILFLLCKKLRPIR